MSTSDINETAVPESLESFVSKIDNGQKPWYLTSTIVYDAVKKTVSSIPHSQAVFDKSIDGIVALTEFINGKTGSRVLIIDQERANEMITKLDGVLADQFIRVDDGFDYLRTRLAASLRKLIESLVEQKKLAIERLVEQKKLAIEKSKEIIAQAESARTVTTQYFDTRYEQAAEVFKSLIESAKARCPSQVTAFIENTITTAENKTAEIFATAQSTSNSWLDSLYGSDSRLALTSAYILKTAQPYVHTVVVKGQPYLLNAAEVSQPYMQPYMEQAKPYLDPLVVRAQEVKQRLEEHEIVGPYVTRAYATAEKTLDQVKGYCFSEEEGKEVLTEVCGPVATTEVEEVKQEDVDAAQPAQHAQPAQAGESYTPAAAQAATGKKNRGNKQNKPEVAATAMDA